MASVAGAESALTPIVRDSTPALIAGLLRTAIAAGEFRPGQQLQEAQLATRLGVSRGPLREAMQRLTQDGLLVSHRNRGLFVMDLDESAIRDIYLARTAVERAAVRAVIDRGDGAQADCLTPVLDEMATCEAHARISALDMEFHARLVALSGSPRLQRMHGALLTQVQLCLALMEACYDNVAERVDEHRAIAATIVAGDAETADRLVVAHMDDGLRRLLALVSEDC